LTYSQNAYNNELEAMEDEGVLHYIFFNPFVFSDKVPHGLFPSVKSVQDISQI